MANVWRIVGTLALVGVLSLAFYLVVLAVTGVAGVQYWAMLAVGVPSVVLGTARVVQALRSGEMPMLLARADRITAPGAFRFALLWTAVTTLLLSCLCAYAIWHLVAAMV